jgi:hypothetical protein
MLAGLLLCAGCGRVLRTGIRDTGTSGAARWYLCPGLDRGQPCPAPVHVRDTVVEPYLEAVFWQELSRARGRAWDTCERGDC